MNPTLMKDGCHLFDAPIVEKLFLRNQKGIKILGCDDEELRFGRDEYVWMTSSLVSLRKTI